MGIGYPVDIVVCVALGADMFDSVFPTRTARFGVALVDTHGGFIKLKQSQYRGTVLPILGSTIGWIRYHVCELHNHI